MESESGTESEDRLWVGWFLGDKGNEYFCEVDFDFILDRFNLTGLNTEVPYFQQALNLINDAFDADDYEEREKLEVSARVLYGLIHARFILTSHGLEQMLKKYKHCDFGRCPRVDCEQQALLPCGLSDVLSTDTVKLFCPKCEDLYKPKSYRHINIDGAFFGTTFPHMFMQFYPHCIPSKSSQRYIPKIFGLHMHDAATLARWQELKRREMMKRLLTYKKRGELQE
ncbi:hypothetical protein CANCADRAFT_3724 [Tortispora caseinolytica NRRL Y-17796]|uniref:Casein kinase II subunit beta n=1 Tax=Tortispora caseinolytica NRRL Y-17796 TaxID=767744 RepID=A0A1E4TBE7_9ASCO|nr:hypothetical protein CANCADRAFT_3724 [Tortispora caseinolytica NRRL Y-17796]